MTQFSKFFLPKNGICFLIYKLFLFVVRNSFWQKHVVHCFTWIRHIQFCDSKTFYGKRLFLISKQKYLFIVHNSQIVPEYLQKCFLNILSFSTFFYNFSIWVTRCQVTKNPRFLIKVSFESFAKILNGLLLKR